MLTDSEIKKIVRMTIRETYKTDRMKYAISEIYEEISQKLRRYYNGTEYSSNISIALDALRNDLYYDIIPLYYQQGKTVDNISRIMNIDSSTVVRHKKRLCLELFSMLEE